MSTELNGCRVSTSAATGYASAMQLTPRKLDRLLLYQAAELARSRRDRGRLLNAPKAIAHGMADEIGSIEIGKLADIVLWSPAWFAVKPFLVLKAGFPTWGMSGDPNASTAFSEPTRIAAQIGAIGTAPARLSLAFTSRAAIAGGGAADLPTSKQRIAVHGTRSLGAADMVRNTRTAAVRVDPVTHAVSVDGEIIDTPPVTTVPLSSLHLLG